MFGNLLQYLFGGAAALSAPPPTSFDAAGLRAVTVAHSSLSRKAQRKRYVRRKMAKASRRINQKYEQKT
jgi:hypothetical protein